MERSPSLKKSLDDVKYEQYVNNLHDRLPQLTALAILIASVGHGNFYRMQKIL